MDAYCLKCKEKIEVKDPEMTKTSRGLRMVKGTCPKCNGKVAKMLGK
jgi:hypothetical protein